MQETKKDYGEAKRKGRAGRMAPVDFRPAPLVAPRGGGDRRGGNRYNNNRGDYKQSKVSQFLSLDQSEYPIKIQCYYWSDSEST